MTEQKSDHEVKAEETPENSEPKQKYSWKRCRNWCFTDNSCLLTDRLKDYEKVMTKKPPWIKGEETAPPMGRYIIIGEEKAPTTGKIHWQGWIQVKQPQTLARMKQLMPDGIHLLMCRGNEIQNDKYCSKEGKLVYQEGVYVTQGERTDLKEIYQKIEKGAKIVEIADEYPKQFTRYFRAFYEYKKLKEFERRKKFRKVNVTFITGPTGCGKTRFAVESAEDDDWFKIEGSEMKWWDGYEGQKTLVIDEYANDVKITKMLNYLDGYQLRLPIKCSFTYAGWTQVFITSNLRPDELHLNANPMHRHALFRRITEIKNMWDDESYDYLLEEARSQSAGNTRPHSPWGNLK